MPVRIEWKQVQVENQTRKQVAGNMLIAMRFVEGYIKKLLQKGQPIRRTRSKRIVGLNPSVEGEPPHVLLGRLRQSITHQVEENKKAVIGRIGTNVIYARRLELGFMGKDKLGRIIHQGPRPFLRRGIKDKRADIVKRLVGK